MGKPLKKREMQMKSYNTRKGKTMKQKMTEMKWGVIKAVNIPLKSWENLI